MQPILAMAAQHALQAAAGQPSAEGDADEASAPPRAPTGEWSEAQEPLLLSVIAEELGVPASDIADFELSLYDTQACCGLKIDRGRADAACPDTKPAPVP